MRRRENQNYTCVFLKLDFVAVARCCVVESSPESVNNAVGPQTHLGFFWNESQCAAAEARRRCSFPTRCQMGATSMG
jgi:hypothetical protein